MNTSLAFQNTRFDVIDHCGQPWLRAQQIGKALGYADEKSINRIYTRNSDEFTEAMTTVVKVTTSGNLFAETRIFSLRGAHLLGMLANTAVAAAFRAWVLDILEGKIQLNSAAPVAANLYPPNVLTFNGVPVLSNARLAAAFGLDRSTLRSNTVAHPHDFKPGVHYFKLSGTALRNFLLSNMHTGEVTRRSCSSLIIWSQDGIEAHARLFPPSIAQRGRQAIANYLAGDSTPLLDNIEGDWLPAANVQPAGYLLGEREAAALHSVLKQTALMRDTLKRLEQPLQLLDSGMAGCVHGCSREVGLSLPEIDRVRQYAEQAYQQQTLRASAPLADADRRAPPSPPRLAAVSGQPARIVLTFADAAALGQAMPELLALTSRHAAGLSMEGGAA